MNTTETSAAFGAPGIEPRWTSSAKEGLGTAYHTSCRVWFTLSHGIANEIYNRSLCRIRRTRNRTPLDLQCERRPGHRLSYELPRLVHAQPWHRQRNLLPVCGRAEHARFPISHHRRGDVLPRRKARPGPPARIPGTGLSFLPADQFRTQGALPGDQAHPGRSASLGGAHAHAARSVGRVVARQAATLRAVGPAHCAPGRGQLRLVL